MTESELDNEIDAIDAIYPQSIEKIAPGIINLRVDGYPEMTVQLAFPERYPSEKPTVVQAISSNPIKYSDDKYVEDKVNKLIDSLFMNGNVMIFELYEELHRFLEEHEKNLELLAAMKQSEKGQSASPPLEKMKSSEHLQEKQETTEDYLQGWIQSDPIVDRGSTFIAFAREVHSVDEARRAVNDLTCDRKISKATHNMNAMRIKGANGISYQDCDDDGETAAGSRMLHLMTIMDVWDVIVVVSRWFGGTHIGPDRFKHINAATRDVLVKGQFCQESMKKKR